MKKEIEDWLDQKLHEFMVQENRNPHISKERWLDRYIYTKNPRDLLHDLLVGIVRVDCEAS